jgi:hypothetical protein
MAVGVDELEGRRIWVLFELMRLDVEIRRVRKELNKLLV